MAERNSNGQFLTGHTGAGGRPPEQYKREVLDALRTRFPPEWIAGAIADTWDAANKPGAQSSKGMAQVLEILLDRLMGRPVPTEVTPEGNGIDDIIARVKAQMQPHPYE